MNTKPIIGISSSLKDQVLLVPTDNIQAISDHGGVPIVLPNLQGDEVESIAQLIDGLLLTGGGDIDPTLFGEEPLQGLGTITPERDNFEIAIIQKMIELNKPILGICRGSQILNIAVGGDMYQDIYSQHEKSLLQHTQLAVRSHASHFVQVNDGTILRNIVQREKLKVNSFHHQAVRRMPKDFQVSALASDGVIEAFESKIHHFVMGVQWHPENMVTNMDSSSAAIFRAFTQACVSKSL